MPESAIIPGNECPELCGPVDQFDNPYAGPRCDGCEHCEGYEAIKVMLRTTFPYKPCFITGHNHQMAFCGGCGNKGFHHGGHWYCPELIYKSGQHVSPVSTDGRNVSIIEEDFADEAL